MGCWEGGYNGCITWNMHWGDVWGAQFSKPSPQPLPQAPWINLRGMSTRFIENVFSWYFRLRIRAKGHYLKLCQKCPQWQPI